jgi:tripartite ATP-independent transporter DctM subunit
MDPVTIGFIGIGIMVVLIFAGFNIGVVLSFVGYFGFVTMLGWEKAFHNMYIIPFSTCVRYEFAVVPLFMLMGTVVGKAGIGEDAYHTARAWVGHIRGGLAMATVCGCGLFAATSGSSLATAVTMGKVAYPEMRKLKYDSKLAIGCIAAGGSLGLLIPPSMAFILIGVLTEVSIGRLFLAGIIPGIVEVAVYCGAIWIMCKLKPFMGPPISPAGWGQRITAIKKIWAVVVLFIVVIGGIYGGVFTPTEAGGIGALGAVIIGLLMGRLGLSELTESFLESGKQIGMIIVMLVGAFIFMRFLAYTQIPSLAAEWVTTLGLSPFFVLMVIIISFFFLGMFFDMFAVIILTVPILFPLMTQMGYDPLWFGVIMCRMLEIGMITPPFGINLFGLAASANVPVATMYRGIIPFVLADIVVVAILVAFPILSTFIPMNLM